MIAEPLFALLTGLAAIFALVFIRVPIGLAMLVCGVVGITSVIGLKPALSLVTIEQISAFSSSDLLAVPLFVLMANFAVAAGLSADIYRVAAQVLGRFRGGLAFATVATCAGFGAICGSSLATTTAMTKIAFPEMERRNYGASLAAGSVAAGSSLGILMPPSILMVVYAVLTEQFVLDLFLAGIIPALITVGFYIGAIHVAVRLNPALAPVPEAPKPIDWAQLLRDAARPVLVGGVVFVGLYGGLLTVMEVASFGAVLTGAFYLLRAGRNFGEVAGQIHDAVLVSGMILVMVIGAHVFGYFVTLTQAPSMIVEAVADSGIPDLAVLALILVMYLILGAIFDAFGAILMTLPFVFPLVMGMGYDPVWWAIINVIIVEIALITPPIGMNAFVMHGTRGDVPLGTIYRGIVPFLVADILRLALFVLVPGLVVFLPRLLM